MSESSHTLSIDVWPLLSAKAEGEAEETVERCTQGEGLRAHLRIHMWFTRTIDQGRRMKREAIMHAPNASTSMRHSLQ